ncbi:hypothetical protein F0562_031789 [Nyssa sinensis]|uniref:DUF3741 domain-containing protein n=1 Tax=Nyssa sinensis TaxID=561372 RepID=A0A5J5AX12_9ASTE|nr:hypothetical protein F0562_031789 [Nyssa sinensis]
MVESGELSKEMEPKQRTPSVIARLMGLDEMPPQQPVHKQQRVLSENYLRKTASIGLRERRSCYEGGSFRRNVETSQEYKDVFEVPEIPKMYYKHRIQSVPKGRTNSSMTEAKLACMKQKLTNAKCLSMDKKFQHLKEFDDVLEELDSNNDLLLRYFWQVRFFVYQTHP